MAVSTTEQQTQEQQTQAPLPQTIAEHRRLYGSPEASSASKTPEGEKAPEGEKTPEGEKAPATADAKTADKATQPPADDKGTHHSAEQRRDGENGRFEPGKRRGGKAREAATRIDQLTGRARTAEDRVAALEQELQQIKAGVTTATKPFDATKDPEPKEASYPNTAQGFQQYLDDRSRWVARQEYARLTQGQATDRATSMARTSHAQTLETFGERIAEARGRIKDLDKSLEKPVPWLHANGNRIRGYEKIDEWITRHPNGVDVLHYLQTHPTEIDALMRMDEFGQTEFLALLSQQRTASAGDRAGATGSAAGTHEVNQPPKPPNPVRSGAQRTVDTAPPTDGSLSIAEHRKAFGTPRR